MHRDEILGVYDDWYASTYEERFTYGLPWTDSLTAYQVDVIRELLPAGGRWLDVACGLGGHLSHFPDVERAGLDLSPSMLASAREANPGATFFEGSYMDPRPEWEGQWDLVTNLWIGYQYVESTREVEHLLANLASWVSPSGSFMIHVIDCEDVARGIDLPWEDPETPVFADSLFITGVLWSWRESNGRVHRDLLAPQLQRMVNLIARHFEDIEVRRWPAIEPGADRPKAVIGHKKRATPLTEDEVGITYPYRLTFPPRDHPLEHGFDVDEAALAAERAVVAAAELAEAEARRTTDRLEVEANAAREGQRAAEEALRVAASEASVAAAHWDAERDDLRRVAEAAEARAEHVEGSIEGALRSPTDVLTGRLVRELIRRANPKDGRLWIALRRRVAKVLPGRR